MRIELEIPSVIPHGHGASFKKGIADAILESAKTDLAHTPEGHDDSRKKGLEVGKEIAKLVSIIINPNLKGNLEIRRSVLNSFYPHQICDF